MKEFKCFLSVMALACCSLCLITGCRQVSKYADDIWKAEVLYDNRLFIVDIVDIGKRYYLKAQEYKETDWDYLIESASNELIICSCK